MIKSVQNDLQKDWGTEEKNYYEQSVNLVNKPVKKKEKETASEPKSDIVKELQVMNHPTAGTIDKKDTSIQSDKQYKMEPSITDFLSKTSNKELPMTPNVNTTTKSDDFQTKKRSQFHNYFYNNKIIQNYSGSILVLTCSLIIIATYLRMTK